MAQELPKSGEGTVMFIGKKSTMAYVMSATMQMKNKGITEITLKARGKAISRAVDVAEILKNKFTETALTDEIKIYTEKVPGKGDDPIKVSAIEISLKK